MAQKALNRNVIPASRRALSNTLDIHATHKEYVLRSFSSSQLPETDVSYKKFKKLLATRTSVVIDVREPWELREYGNIPGQSTYLVSQCSQIPSQIKCYLSHVLNKTGVDLSKMLTYKHLTNNAGLRKYPPPLQKKKGCE
uniref:Rhodanese domain-containing protein n=1 Tax=Salmo trutta TaxID=8032 RepID=A0A673VW38_SALTR